MSTRKTTFGLLIDWPDNNSKYQSSLIKGISSFAARHDINLIMLGAGRLGSSFSYEKPREILYDFMENHDLFSGFILFSSALSSISGTEKLVEKITGVTSLPVVSIAVDLPGAYSVVIDNRPGFCEIIEHMILFHGYRNIAYISGPQQNGEASERLSIVRELFIKHGLELPASHLYFGDFTTGAGRKAVSFFLDEMQIMPEAIIAANDNMVMGAWEVLQERNISIPEDIAITGFDDLQISNVFDLPFTTVKQPLFRQGYDAAEKLFRVIRGEQVAKNSVLSSQVVYRHSCGCLAGQMPSTGKDAPRNGIMKMEDFFEKSRTSFTKAVSRAVSGKEANVMIRCWNRIVLSAIEQSLRQAELFSLIYLLEKTYSEGSFKDNEKSLVSSFVDKMKIMAAEFYIQADLLSRATDETATKAILNQLEGLGNHVGETGNLPDQLSAVRELIPRTQMDYCTISLFNSLHYIKDGLSRIVYYYQDGEEKILSSPVPEYATRELLHPEVIPERRYEILVELLFEQDSVFGLLFMDVHAKGINIYELLRTRLSGIIQEYKDRKILTDLNRQLSDEIEIRLETEKKLHQVMHKLNELSFSDDLTGLYNRRGFLKMGEQQYRYCLREEEPFVLFYMDMDGLKRINDSYGHNEGDRAIKCVAKVLAMSFRDTDIVARLGGDEFTVFASKADEESIQKIKERIENNLETINGSGERPYDICISIGTYFSQCAMHKEEISLEEMLNVADRELYKVKNNRKT